MRFMRATGADGFGRVEEYDPATGDAIAVGGGLRQVRGADGIVRLVGGDNSCWSSDELRRRSGGAATGLY